ncbi:hypothetical protein V6N13_021492 [Hibiscus sabdariffa]|uniref:Uncharacterized protein n=1 Tax=Hibiscus sabdariffa TaxID=183260 RepID=A0ABR2NPH3_9ROSI
MDEYKKVTGELCGAKVWWAASNVVAPSWPMGYYPEQEKSYCRSTVHKRYMEMITCVCLEHVVKEEKEVSVRNRQRKLYTNSPGYKWPSYKQTMWSCIVFETMARLNRTGRKEIIEHLVMFSPSKEFHSRIGEEAVQHHEENNVSEKPHRTDDVAGFEIDSG